MALPSIQSGLNFSSIDLQWVVDAYAGMFAGFLLLGVRLVDQLGQRRVFAAALCLFSFSSIIGGAAVNREMLVIARGFQGLSCAVMAAASLAIVPSLFPPGPRLRRAVGWWLTMNGAGVVSGVVLGGIITETLGWRWVFLINPPIGIAAAIAAWAGLADRRRARKGRVYDVAGAATLTLGQAVLVFGVVQAGARGWLADAALGPIIAGLVLLGLFCMIEVKVARDPLVPFRTLNKPLRAANTIVLIFSAALFPLWYLTSLYLQEVLGLSPTRTGLAFLPMALTIMLVARTASMLAGRFGVRAVLGSGLTMMAVGLLLFTRIAAGGSVIVHVLVPGVLTAGGIGMATVASRIAATKGVKQGQTGLALAMVDTSEQLGRVLGIAVLITFATALTNHLIGHGHGVQQALTDGFRLGYWIAAGLTAAAAVATFVLLPKPGEYEARSTRRIQIAMGLGLVLVCLIGADIPVAGSHGAPIGVYTSRGAYRFISAPGIRPPIVRADVAPTHRGQLAKGYIFTANFYEPDNPPLVGQSGPLILDRRLSPVWFRPVPEDELAGNLSLQTYETRPVLAWWQGTITTSGVTQSGQYVVVDQHYRPVARLHGADGWVLTLHEIAIRGEDAWVTASKNLPMNLSRYGGAHNGALTDSAVQEYNLKTGRLLWSWDALAHIPPSDSWAPIPTNADPWDAYHVNSIDLPGDGSFVVSMRNTWAAYKVDIATGRIEWTLGGKRSSFRFGPGAQFQWQHDVTVYPGTSLVTVFDDHCCQVTRGGVHLPPTGPSRGLVLKLDRATHTATLANQYTHRRDADSEYMGNIQLLRGGNVFVGWGSEPRFSEYTASGRILLDAVLPGSDINCRASIEPWVGLPLYPPVGAARHWHDRTTVYASWNGATEVGSWRVLARARGGRLMAVGTAPRTGFETSIACSHSHGPLRVQALNAHGRVLATSEPFGVEG